MEVRIGRARSSWLAAIAVGPRLAQRFSAREGKVAMGPLRVTAAGLGLVAVLLNQPEPPAGTVGAAGNGASPIVVINEFTPSGLSSTDEFLELRNTSDQTAALHGWQLWACLSGSTPTLLAVFGVSDEIGPGQFMLLAHVDWSGQAAPDIPYDGWDVPDDGGWLLIDTSNRSDRVGLDQGVACTETEPAPPCTWPAGEAVTRDADGTDTDNNAVDFTCQARTPGR